MTGINCLTKIKKPIPLAIAAFFISLLWFWYGPSLRAPLEYLGLRASSLSLLSLPTTVIFIACLLLVDIKDSNAYRIIYSFFVSFIAVYLAIVSLVVYSCVTVGSCL
jgi:hypothetical protein